ncbi:hypothetical protein [Timonella sp. A28]|uniref:hypothetical protein n=1 Tax=Timonella sp. A28 TaxID=3442640 RepID=UPI003EBA76FD
MELTLDRRLAKHNVHFAYITVDLPDELEDSAYSARYSSTLGLSEIINFLHTKKILAAVHKGKDLGIDYQALICVAIHPESENVVIASEAGQAAVDADMDIDDLASHLSEISDRECETYESTDNLLAYDAGDSSPWAGTSLQIMPDTTPASSLEALISDGGWYSLKDSYALSYPSVGQVGSVLWESRDAQRTRLCLITAGERKSLIIYEQPGADALMALHHVPAGQAVVDVPVGSDAHTIQQELVIGQRLVFKDCWLNEYDFNKIGFDEVPEEDFVSLQTEHCWKTAVSVAQRSQELLAAPADQFFDNAIQAAALPPSLASSVRWFNATGGPARVGVNGSPLAITYVKEHSSSVGGAVVDSVKVLLSSHFKGQEKQASVWNRFRTTRFFYILEALLLTGLGALLFLDKFHLLPFNVGFLEALPSWLINVLGGVLLVMGVPRFWKVNSGKIARSLLAQAEQDNVFTLAPRSPVSATSYNSGEAPPGMITKF